MPKKKKKKGKNRGDVNVTRLSGQTTPRVSSTDPERVRKPYIGPAGAYSHADVVAAKAALKAEMAALLGVEASLPLAGTIVGYGVGPKFSQGRRCPELAVKVYVAEKLPSGMLSRALNIRSQIAGIPTDIEPAGQFRARPGTLNDRVAAASSFGEATVCPGASIYHEGLQGWGTLGTLVKARVNSRLELCILSNNHILANTNKPGGKSVLRTDTGRQIGKLLDFRELKSGGRVNYIDAALAGTHPDVASARFPNFTLYGGVPDDTLFDRPEMGLGVLKQGAKTGYTYGEIVDTDADTSVDYGDLGSVSFRDQIMVRTEGGSTPFGDQGDSGSLAVSARTQRPVGLYFADNEGPVHYSLANPIEKVIEALGIEGFYAFDSDLPPG